MSEPFADFVGVTVDVSEWPDLRGDLFPLLDGLGMSVEVDEARKLIWRSDCGNGTVKASRFAQVWSLGCSGTVCAGLRLRGMFNAYLSAIGSRPHKVTRLDASLDRQVDAPPVIQAMAAKGRAGQVSLTRKAIKPRDVRTILSPRDSDGELTGTAYFGPRRADAQMVMYDKQEERLSRGMPDCGPLLRYEIHLRAQCGVTLRDCAEPAAVFWHYASPDFLPAPPDAPVWTPYGSGFVPTPADVLFPAERLRRRVDASPDVKALLDLTREVGPYGFDFLVSLLRKRGGFEP